MLKFRNILVLLGLLGCALAWGAEPVTLSGDRDQVEVARSMEVLVDPEGHWDFQTVRGRLASRFRANDSAELNFGFTGSVIWLRFALDAGAVSGEDWYLVERYPILDNITLFAPTADGGYRRVDMGDTLPFHHRLMNHRAFIFPWKAARRRPGTTMCASAARAPSTSRPCCTAPPAWWSTPTGTFWCTAFSMAAC
ncbi:hypothetical protein ASALC70_01769 [Alcanivorax sp. ALC70]|nr:hypothetical protein ASALC70_01769 [Alcanivorax sp. ALC70]